MNKKPNPISQQRSQSVKQKISRQMIIAGSSVFALVVASIIYFNFSNSSISKANDTTLIDIPNYRTTEISVPKRILRKPSTLATENLPTDKITRSANTAIVGRDVMSPIIIAE